MILDVLLAGLVLGLVIIIGVGIHKRRILAGPVERFGAGRQMHWLTLGASLAASAMSADTPLLVAGAVYTDGLAGNWFWWAGAPGVLATLFFFARLWRRSGVLTEVEIFRLRYGTGVIARRYRMFQALIEGVVLNILVLASNGYAFSLVLNAMMRRWHIVGFPELGGWLTILCFIGSAVFAILVGFRGLVKSDAAEFFVSIIAALMLAGLAIAALPDGIASLRDLHSTRHGAPVFGFWPHQDRLAPALLLLLGWWHAAPGRNMVVQRIVASRDEKSAMLTVGTFAVFQFLMRPWAWYLIGASALFYLPAHSNPDEAVPALAAHLLPHGLFGVMLAATALAFFGCVNSRLNYGASFVVNDVAMTMQPSISLRNTRRVEILIVGFLTAGSILLLMSGVLSSIRAIYQFLTMMLAGTGFVAIARWYWWRTTIVSEVASFASATLGAGLSLMLVDISQPADFAIALAMNFMFGAAVTIIGAYAVKPTPLSLLQAFHGKVSPGGPGWRHFGESYGPNLALLLFQWGLACIALFSAIFAGTRFLSGELFTPAILLGVTALALITLRKSVARSWADQRSVGLGGDA